MPRKYRSPTTLAASVLMFALSAATALAQRGLLPAPVTDTPPPVPSILQNYKPGRRMG